MPEKGWIKLHRKLKECWIWTDDEQFDKRSAWIDLILTANHSDKKILLNGSLTTIKRGQILTSVRKLSERWKWSKDKVYRFLKVLVQDGMITKDSDKDRTLLTLVNYEVYQIREDTDEDTNGYTDKDTDEDTVGTPTRTPTSHKQEYIKNDKECNKNDKKDNYIYNAREDDFGFKAEIAWGDTFAIYPRDEGYATAKQIWMNKLLDVIPQNRQDMAKVIYKAVKAYVADYDSKHPKSENYKYARRFDKWLTEDCDYWISQVEKGERE